MRGESNERINPLHSGPVSNLLWVNYSQVGKAFLDLTDLATYRLPVWIEGFFVLAKHHVNFPIQGREDKSTCT